MAITLEQAKQLKYRDILVFTDNTGKKYNLYVTGQVKTWKKDQNRIKIPVKWGLYRYGYITNGSFEGGKHINLNINEVDLEK